MVKKLILVQCDYCPLSIACSADEDYHKTMKIYGWEEIQDKQYCTRCAPRIKEHIRQVAALVAPNN